MPTQVLLQLVVKGLFDPGAALSMTLKVVVRLLLVTELFQLYPFHILG